MYRWILAALAALGLLGSAPVAHKSNAKPGSPKAPASKPVPAPQSCTRTDGQPSPPLPPGSC